MRILSLTIILTVTAVTMGEAQQEDHLERVRRILRETPLIDGHNDLPWAIREDADAPRNVAAYDIGRRTAGHTDIERLRAGGVGGQFWSVYIPADYADSGFARVQLEQIDIAREVIERYGGDLELAGSASDIERAFGRGRIASMLGIEGGHAIENSLGALRAFYRLGVRYMTITHSRTIDWADAGTDEARHGGLTAFGREVVREMNRLGMLVDLSHTAPSTMHDALDASEAPVIFSHSSARGVRDHPRNVPDDVLERMPANGGVVMVTFVSGFITDEGPGTIADVADHIEHVVRVASVDHVGLGADYDGTQNLPVGLEDVSTYPALLVELAARGWSDDALRKLVGENILRVLRDAERVARRLQRERGPSMATIEDLDGAGERDRPFP